jgi:diguanylate cyclase (GGDEF)-like protein
MLDTRTLMIAVALGNLALAVLLAAVARGNALAFSGRLWGVAKFGLGLGFLLIGLRGVIPDLVSIPIANVILVTGFIFEFAATWELLHLRYWRKAMAPLLFVGVGGFVAAYVLGAPSSVRALFIGAVITVCYGLTAVAFFVRWRRVSVIGKLVGIADLAGASIAIWRTAGFGAGQDPSPFSNSPAHVLTFILLYMYMVLHGFGFLLLTKEDADRETFRLATLDSLTETLNRRSFFAQTEAAWALARRNAQPLSMLMLDLDHFKRINDNHGHQAGDDVIRAFVGVCRSHLRESDILGRVGGEEFAVALPSTNLEGAMRVAERIRDEVAKSTMRVGGAELHFTVSIGATQAESEAALDLILGCADGALYEAKRLGRNRVVSMDAVAAVTA